MPSWTVCLREDHTALRRAGCASVVWNDRFILIFGGREKDRFYLDCWEYDTVEKTIRLLAGTDQAPMSPSPQPPSRAHHTATLVGDVVYLIGGSGKDGLVTDVWCFHIKTSSWEKPQLSGRLELLQRTAHGACLHPTRPRCILIYGGYGAVTSKNDRDPVWLADFVILDTKAGAISAMFPDGTEHAAGARGYHSLTAFGHWCIVLFGRQDSHTIVSPQKSVAVYNSRSNCWEAVAWKRILTKEDDDQLPPIRSSHRACATTNGILVYGGAPPGIERLSKRRHSASSNGYKSNGRLSDLWLLGIDSETGIMEWKSVEESRSNGKIALEQPELPEGRAGHIMEVVQDDVLYLMGGYNKKSSYCSDIWCWKQNSDVLNSSKKPHENSSRRLLPSPTVTKRARRNQHGGGAGNGSSIEQLHDTIADLQATLKNYQSRESSLLLNQERAVAEIERLRKELRTTDESWQQTARERDYFKVESSEQSARLSSERSEREAQRKALEQRIESLLLETEELKNSLEMTKVNLTNAQAQVNIVQQAAENDRNLLNDLYNNVRKQNEILLSRIDSETSQRQQAEHKVEGIEGILAAERVGWEEERAKMKYELSQARALQVKIKSQAKEAIKEVFCKLDQLHHRLQQVKDTTDRAAAAQRRTEELAALARTDNQRLLENVERDQGECNRDVEALRSTLSRMARNLDGAAGLSGDVL